MQRLEPILKSWVIWLTLAASAAGFAALVVTDDSAGGRDRASSRTRRPGTARRASRSGMGRSRRDPNRGGGPDARRGRGGGAPRAVGRLPGARGPDDPRPRMVARRRAPGRRRGIAARSRPRADHVDHGDDVREVTHGRVTSASVAWSPDGQRLVYDLGRSAHPERGQPLVVSRVDGSDRHVITPPREFAVAPAWSPDGRRSRTSSGCAGRVRRQDGLRTGHAGDGRRLAHGRRRVRRRGPVVGAQWPDRLLRLVVAERAGVRLGRDESGRGTPFLAFDCTAVLRCEAIGSPTFGAGGGRLGSS